MTKPTGVAADHIASGETDPAEDRTRRTVQAVRLRPELTGESVILRAKNASFTLDPVRIGMGVYGGMLRPTEPGVAPVFSRVLDESNARFVRELFGGYSAVASPFAKFATAPLMGESLRRAMVDALAPTTPFGPFIQSGYSTLFAAAQMMEAVQKAMLASVAWVAPWDALHQRLRVRQWLWELGSEDDPASVELVEVDGAEFGPDFSACWFAYLGQRIEGRPAGGEAQVVTLGDTTLSVWGIRIYHDDTDTFVEIRHPPWGTGKPDIRSFDPYRPAVSLRVISGLRALGYGRRRGRRPLTELWTGEEFHCAYRRAEDNVGARRAGKSGNQLDIAGELSMSDRHLRRLINLHGLPDEKRS